MPEVTTQVDPGDSLKLSGHDLDRAVALAFGFKPLITWEVFNEDETATMIGFEREAAAIKWWDEHPSVHSGHHIGTLEHYEPYSSSIDAAMRVESKIAEMNLEDEYGDALTSYFSKALQDQFMMGRGAFYGSELFEIAHATAEQRCRAALKAIESQVISETSR